MHATTAQSFHLEAGMMTDLSRHRAAVECLPAGLEALARVVQGLLVHEAWTRAYGFAPPPERHRELSIRPAARMIDTILALDPAPLDVPRPVERRMLGTCRDFATLVCALLKRSGIPARARCGFGTYFERDRYVDHWVCEFWHAPERRWVLADAQIDALQRESLGVTFDTLDMPRDEFLVAGRAWQLCRAGERDPERFGIYGMGGMWFISANLFRDLASLNRVELLPWDTWGLLDRGYDSFGAEELALHDRMAELCQGGDEAFPAQCELFRSDERIRVPAVITSRTPGRSTPEQVELPG